MTDFIVKHWLTVLFGLATTGIAASYRHLTVRTKKDKLESEALKTGVQALLKDRIIDLHNDYVERGHCPIYVKQNVESLYSAYHALGGNGTVTKLHDRLMGMPTEKQEEEK